MGIEPLPQDVGLAAPRGVENAADGLNHLRWPGFALRIAGDELDRFESVRLGDLVNGAAVVVGCVGVEARGNGALYCFDVTRARGVEDGLAVGQSGRGPRIDVGQRARASSRTGHAGDVALGRGELRCGIIGAQREQPVLGGFPQPLEIGIGRQSLGHDVPSFFAPGDRGSRARKKEDVQRSAGGGLNPLRGPSVACSTGAETSAGGPAESICRAGRVVP